MKYLVNNLFYYFIILSFIYSNECFFNWNNSIINNSNKKILHLKGVRTSDDNSNTYPIDLYYLKDEGIIRFDYYRKSDYSDRIKYIFNNEKSIKIHDDTNQLFITDSDKNLVDFFLQLFSHKFLHKNSKNIKIASEEYIMKLENYFLEINFKIKDCLILDQVKIKNLSDTSMTNKLFKIDKISINYLDVKNYDKIFTVGNHYFEYELRK